MACGTRRERRAPPCSSTMASRAPYVVPSFGAVVKMGSGTRVRSARAHGTLYPMALSSSTKTRHGLRRRRQPERGGGAMDRCIRVDPVESKYLYSSIEEFSGPAMGTYCPRQRGLPRARARKSRGRMAQDGPTPPRLLHG